MSLTFEEFRCVTCYGHMYVQVDRKDIDQLDKIIKCSDCRDTIH